MRSTGVVVIFLLLSPAVLMAQTDTPQIVDVRDLVTPPGSAVSGVAHVEDIKIGTRREFHIVATTNDGSGELWFDGKTMRFGDGYTMVRETLADAPGVQVLRLTGTAPNGDSESAIIISNLKTGKASSHGIERFSKLLAKSADQKIIGAVLPLVTDVPAGSSRLRAMSGVDCASAVLTFASLTAGAISSCTSGNVLGCGFTVAGAGMAAYKLSSACPDNAAADGTIGWG